MSGGEAIGAQLAGEGDQVDELHALVAGGARHRRSALRIFVDEAVDHPFAEAAFIIEHVMGDAEAVGDLLGVVNVLPRAAGARSAARLRRNRRAASVTPITSAPVRAASAAVTELSTPPDMATTIRAPSAGRAS